MHRVGPDQQSRVLVLLDRDGSIRHWTSRCRPAVNDAGQGRASGVLTRVLVVEDDTAVATTVADLLALEGLAVTL